MICWNCGTEMPDGAAFCPECGSRMTGEEARPTQPTPQPTQATPQPVVAQPAEPQPACQAPAATAAVPSAAPAKKRPPIAALVAAALVVVALAGFGISRLLFGSNKYFDANGNPTLLAITELSGDELCDKLEAKGWQWDDDECWFTSPDGENHFSVFDYNTDSWLSCSVIRELQAFGAGEPVDYVIRLNADDYPSTSDVVSALVSDAVTVDATEWLDDRGGTAS